MGPIHIERLLEAGLLLATPYPAWRYTLYALLRTDIKPKAIFLAVVLLLAGYSVGVVAIAVHTPNLLRWLAIAAVAGLAAFWWRGRADFGAARGLPPGRMRLLPLQPISDHRFYLDEAQRYGPVFKSGTSYLFPTLRPVIRIVGTPLAMDLFRRFDSVLAVKPRHNFNRFIPRGFLRYMEPDDHRAYGKVFRAAMSQDLVEERVDLFAEAARATLAEMAEVCAEGPKEGVDPRPHLKRMMFVVLVGLLFGIERGEAGFQRLRHLYGAINIGGIRRWTRRSSIVPCLNELVALVDQQGQGIVDRLTAGGGAGPSMIRELYRIDPGLVHDRTVRGNMILMVDTGSTDVSDLLVWVLKMLGDHPDWSRKLREGYRSAARDGDQLAEGVIKETLRLEQSEWLFRRVEENIETDGYVIPKGSGVQICVREGHRDAAIFERPEDFDPERFMGRSYPPNQYAPFGLYRHRCIAAHLTLVVGRIFLREVCRGFDWRVVADGPRFHGRFHWQPGKHFRVNLTRTI